MKKYILAENKYDVEEIDIFVDIFMPTEEDIKAATEFNKKTRFDLTSDEYEVYMGIVNDAKTEAKRFGYKVETHKSDKPYSLSNYFRCIKTYPEIAHVVILNIRISNHKLEYKDVRTRINKTFNRQEAFLRVGKKQAERALKIKNKPFTYGVTDDVEFIINGLSDVDIDSFTTEFAELLQDLDTNYIDNKRFLDRDTVYREREEALDEISKQQGQQSISESIHINSDISEELIDEIKYEVDRYVSDLTRQAFDIPTVEEVCDYILYADKYLSIPLIRETMINSSGIEEIIREYYFDVLKDFN